jgi:hypothetical protein
LRSNSSVAKKSWKKRKKVIFNLKTLERHQLNASVMCRLYLGPDSDKQANKIIYRAGGVTQVLECLPSKHEALSSNHKPQKKKKKTTLVYKYRHKILNKNKQSGGG